jgi:prepilin-type N-terminal cleavage/methylation domain-containing protein
MLKLKTMKNKGFTLIELLVVISILGFLSSIVMASLNQSRIKAREATIKQTLQSIKTQAELEYSKTGDYSNVATAIAPMLAHINANGGTAKFVSSETIYSSIGILDYGHKHYAVSVKFNTDPTKNWSVSSEGSVVVWDTADIDLGGNPLPPGVIQYMDWYDAQDACKISGGRLPTIEELKALRNAHAVKPTGFQSDYYWSDTTYADYSDGAWVVFMYVGNVGYVYKGYVYGLVRCVR